MKPTPARLRRLERIKRGYYGTDIPRNSESEACLLCPWQPRDRLWVREAWHLCGFHDDEEQPRTEGVYRADSPDGRTCPGCGEPVARWKSPILMPRHASRLALVVKNVSVERLQDITNEGAVREGIPASSLIWRDGDDAHNAFRQHVYDNYGWPVRDTRAAGDREVFAALWDEINGKRAPWDSNPWVWVVSFEVAE